MFEIIKSGTTFDFVGKGKITAAISLILVVASIVLFFTKGLNYGIDFTGGAEVQVQLPGSWDIAKVRSELSDIKGMKVTQIEVDVPAGTTPQFQQYLVKAQGDASSLNLISKQISDTFAKSLQPGEFEIQRVDVVGPAAGESLRMSGYLSMLYALICILIYVTIRFDIRYSPGAVIALFHDTVITLGVFIVLQKPFDLQILAAILALIGYSNNDTIIVR